MVYKNDEGELIEGNFNSKLIETLKLEKVETIKVINIVKPLKNGVPIEEEELEKIIQEVDEVYELIEKAFPMDRAKNIKDYFTDVLWIYRWNYRSSEIEGYIAVDYKDELLKYVDTYMYYPYSYDFYNKYEDLRDRVDEIVCEYEAISYENNDKEKE